eukprot:GHVQ01037061.1.p1 GENE.GHVQ01037061.1~~GHVQ01037061.1.p1  ORF type:complete len:100 (-),score=8.63 GHVQ01037061.1:162-461(-)
MYKSCQCLCGSFVVVFVFVLGLLLFRIPASTCFLASFFFFVRIFFLSVAWSYSSSSGSWFPGLCPLGDPDIPTHRTQDTCEISTNDIHVCVVPWSSSLF